MIKIDMSKGIWKHDTIKPFIQEISVEILSELREAFPDAGIEKEKKLYLALAKIHEKCIASNENERHVQFIFIIDEWDAPLRLRSEDVNGQQEYISWLNDLFKGQNYLALAYMTGILPFKKNGDDSLMNMFDEYSMLEPMELAPYMGFTEKDVEILCKRFGKQLDAYRSWYKGYLLTQIVDTDKMDQNGDVLQEYMKAHAYNPKSITKALEKNRIADYWDRTGMFESLKKLIDRDLLGLRTSILEMMKGGRKQVDTGAYKNNLASMTSVNQVFTLLVHLGYLTYDAESKEVFIPNRELMEEYARTTSEEAPEYSMLEEMLADSMKLLEDTWGMKGDRVAKAIEKSHMHVCSHKDYNNEMALSNAVSFAYYAANEFYTIYPEAPTGKGYADLTFIPVEPSRPAMVVELSGARTLRWRSTRSGTRNTLTGSGTMQATSFALASVTRRRTQKTPNTRNTHASLNICEEKVAFSSHKYIMPSTLNHEKKRLHVLMHFLSASSMTTASLAFPGVCQIYWITYAPPRDFSVEK